MLTAAEAKKKWCPAAQGRDRMANCLASGCMVWRPTDHYFAPTKPGEPDPKPQPVGYCGLAGKP